GGSDLKKRRRTAAVELPYFLFIDAHRRGGIVAVVPPRRVIEVNDEIAIVRGDRFVKHQSPDTRPIAEPAPLKERRAVRRALVRYLDVKSQAALSGSVTSIINLRHDFIAKI